MKRIIKLTENDLHRIVKNAVKTAINEGTKYINNEKNIFKLKCSCQNYDWGQYANNSLVATALRKNGEEVDEKKKYAEYWMGTHPNGPSKIINDNREILLGKNEKEEANKKGC